MPMFHVTLRRAGPEYDPELEVGEQTGFAEHAAYMDSLVVDGVIVLGGLLPNFRTAHAMNADSEEEVRASWARDPWYESHLILESVQPWDIRLDGRERD
jgi:hypothetical protein